MSTSARLEGPELDHPHRLLRPVDVAPDDHRGRLVAELQEDLPGRLDLPGAAPARGVVERDHHVGLGDRREPALDDVPALEPVRQADRREVVAQRRPDAGGDRVGGGDAGDHAHVDVGVVLGGHLEDGAGHGEHARVARGHDGDPTARARQVEGERGALGLDLVVRAVHALTRVRGHAGDVGGVADDVVRLGEGGGRLRGEAVAGAGAEADDGDDPGGRAGRRRGFAATECKRRSACWYSSLTVASLGTRAASPSARAASVVATCTRDGTIPTEKYGTDSGSTSVNRSWRSSVVLARSTYRASSARPARRSAARTPVNVRPSFITAAASVSARRRTSSSSPSVPGSTVRTSSRSTRGVPRAALAADTLVTPGTTSAT